MTGEEIERLLRSLCDEDCKSCPVVDVCCSDYLAAKYGPPPDYEKLFPFPEDFDPDTFLPF